ncbi:efflux RND transporter periplasmic adaptor subunit [Ramlibacter sp. PS4R-6]|uniref:efflux RND transporter periplasmic adaptor subunit n=1 Tax=Ramlibacter sp. PS4R-6 TaxID=3133438 RepID=UPI0030A081BA
MPSRTTYTLIAAAGIAVASLAAWWLQRPSSASTQAASATAAPQGQGAARPPTVEIARVEVMRLADDTQAVGSLRSRQSVMLKPEVSGRVTRINFRDGERVRRGQVLVQLDDQLVAAQTQQAQAELSIARANHKRNQELVAQNFISQRSVDESSANLKVAEAKLALAAANAARMRLVAPFDGIAGIRSISVGDYLKDGADIVNIEDLDAIFVDFRLPERFQTKVQRGQRASVEVDALPGRRFSALVQAVDPAVDANGRSLGIRACIDNRQMQLRPGMFARVTAVFGQRENARVIPEEALVPQAGRQFVYRLADGPDQDTKIAQRVEVKLGLRLPGRVEILEGLQPGDVVISAGQQRVQKDGMPVRATDLRAGESARSAASRPAAAAASAASAPAQQAQAPAAGDPCAMSAPAAAPEARRAARRA